MGGKMYDPEVGKPSSVLGNAQVFDRKFARTCDKPDILTINLEAGGDITKLLGSFRQRRLRLEMDDIDTDNPVWAVDALIYNLDLGRHFSR